MVLLTGQICNKLCWSLSLCSTTGHSKSHSRKELASHSAAVPNASVHHPLWLQKIHQEALLGHQEVVPVGLGDIKGAHVLQATEKNELQLVLNALLCLSIRFLKESNRRVFANWNTVTSVQFLSLRSDQRYRSCQCCHSLQLTQPRTQSPPTAAGIYIARWPDGFFPLSVQEIQGSNFSRH